MVVGKRPKERAAKRPCRVAVKISLKRLGGISGRWLVRFARVPLLPIEFLQGKRVVLPDALTEIAEDFEDGLGLLGSPVVWDKERQPAV